MNINGDLFSKKFYITLGARIIYPVSDLAGAKMMFHEPSSIEPLVDSSHYVGFKFGNQEIGLDPKNGLLTLKV